MEADHHGGRVSLLYASSQQPSKIQSHMVSYRSAAGECVWSPDGHGQFFDPWLWVCFNHALVVLPAVYWRAVFTLAWQSLLQCARLLGQQTGDNFVKQTLTWLLLDTLKAMSHLSCIVINKSLADPWHLALHSCTGAWHAAPCSETCYLGGSAVHPTSRYCTALGHALPTAAQCAPPFAQESWTIVL